VAAAPEPTFPPPEPLVMDGVVIASWYGPGFYGNRTACGQTYTPEIAGVAHRLLPCGTPIRITSPAGITVVVPVIDRGPYVAGRSLDLSNATRAALSCSDLCHVRMTVIR
jgi:rare lipoprotein A